MAKKITWDSNVVVGAKYISKVFYVVIYSEINGAYFREIMVTHYSPEDTKYIVLCEDAFIGRQLNRNIPAGALDDLPESKEEALKEFKESIDKMEKAYNKLLAQQTEVSSVKL